MKKVVLLAGVVAAGMAVAPLAANAAAPKNPEVLTYTGQTPYQEYEHYYHVLANRHTELELMKQEATEAVKAPYKDMSAESLALILGDIQSQIDDLTALQFALESHYNTLSDSQKQDDTYDDATWNTAVENAITYVTTKVTSDQFENLLDTYQAFDAQHKIWEEYDEWYNGADVAVFDDGSDTGFADKFATFKTTDAYKHVDEVSDVASKVGDITTAQGTFVGLLVEPTLDGEGKIVDGIDDALASSLSTAKSGLVADFNEDTTTPGALNALVSGYHNAQNTYLGTGEGMYGAIEASLTAKMTDPANDLTAGDFLLDPADPTSYSHKYATALATKLVELAAAAQAADDFITTFAANDPSDTGWKATHTGEGLGKTDAYEAIANLSEYQTKALALLQKLSDLESDYDDIIEAARANVAAAKALREAEALRQGEMNEAFQTNKTKTVDGADVSYWNRNTERFVMGAMPAVESSVEDAAGYYNYRWHIRDLQAVLNNVKSEYNLDRTTDTTDIHDQIWIWFNDGVADNEHDAVQYKTDMTVNDVVLGQMKTDIETLAAKMKDNEDANNTLHELEALLETHVADMYTTCVGYDDIDAADFANGGQFWSSGDCEDNRHYNGYCRLRRDVIGGFKQAEVTAYDSFDPADDTKGAKAFLEGTAPALDKAAHEAIELIWNHVATVQCNAHLADVNTKMETEFANAKALDTVCKDAADVWDWSVAPEDQECKCAENDTTMNPCGWCDPAVKAQLDAIRAAYNTNVDDLDAAHAGDGSTDTVTYVDAATLFPGVGTAKGLVAAFKAYEEAAAGTDGTIDTWYAAFEAADAAHDAKLKEQWEEANDRIHEYIHEVAGQVSFDIVNFDKGDTAAADKWAQALKDSTFKVYNGEGQEELVLGVDFDLDGTTDEFASFQAFYEAIKAADALYTAEAKKLYDEHKWTELKQLSEKVLGIHGVDTYMVPVNANRTARLELIAELDAKGADFKVLVDEVEAAEGTYYAADLATIDLAGIQGLIGNEATAIQDGYEAATLVDEVAAGTHDEAFLDIDEAINAARVALANAVKRYAANLVAYEALMDQYNNAVTDLKIFVDEAAATTVYNVEGHMDATAIMAAIANLQSNTDPAEADFAQVKDALDAALAAGTVVTNAEDLTDQVAALSAGVTALRTQLAGYVAFYNAEHALAADYNEQLANLETLLKSVVPGDIYGDRSDSEDLGELGDEYRDMIDILTYVENIEKLISTEDGKIAADLDAAKVQANQTAHETALATIETKIKELQKAVVDFEQFKADNQATRDALVNDLTNLLVVAEGLKNYGDVYGEDAEGYDAETIDRAIEDLENSINGDLSFLNAIDYPAGDLLLNEEQYRNSIDVVYAQDIQNIKDIIAGAEQLYAANLRALNNLEEHIKAVETVLHTTKAMCACNECNVEDQAEVDALLTTLDGILDDVNTAFTDTKDLWQQEGAFNGQVEDVETDAANLLALIQLHLDRVQNDLRVYNTLQTLLVSVDAEMLKLEAEEGYEHFKIRGAHLDSAGTMCQYIENNSNPNVKYGNELAQMVEDLKAEIERQHSHEGGHSCEENKIADVKAMNDIKAEIEKTIAAIKANEAAHKLLKERFAELFADAKDAYEFWNKYYSTATLITHEYDIANWIQEWNGELENGYVLAGLENLLHDYYVHGNAANVWTVDGKGEELNGDANDKFAKYDEDLANDRNEFAHTEALNHYAQVKEILDTYKNNTVADYSSEVDGVTSWDPFVRKWENGKFVGVYEDWSEEVEGEYGLYASLRTFWADIEAAYEEGVMEDAINIDNHNTALGIHQQLDGVLGVLTQIEAEYAALFEAAHHLTNGKTVYSDQEYFTLGFFQKANDGLGFQGQEMFNTVVVNDMDKINVLDLTAYESEDVYEDPTDFNSPYTTTYATDEDGNLIRWNDGYATEVQVLVNGNKQNELTFNIPQPMAPLAVTTLLAGPADIEFLPEAITVDEWLTRHNVYISFNVAEPVVEENQDLDGYASSNKLIVRVANPVDLTYTSKVLVATTNTGDQFSFADATFNTAKGQIEFDLPEGTESVVLPEGFFTFRTGENTIARSAACTIAVAGATSIEGLIAMGEKAQIFDLQGRRVKAEALISGNTYVVNGEKVMVK